MSTHKNLISHLGSTVKSSTKTIIKLTLLIACLVPFTNCGGFAAPQTSIPLPENNPVSISGPDANGIVTLTSGANANLASAKLIITVNSSAAETQINSELLSAHVLNYFVRPAMAQSVCSTGLTTTCPNLDDNNQCESTANADGSFSVEVLATGSDSISASYLDPTSCEEVVLIEGESIPTDVFTLNFEGMFLKWEYSINSLFVFGDDNGTPILMEYDTSNLDIKSTTELTDLVLPSSGSDRGFFEYVEFADSNSYISLMSGEKPLFLPYSTSMTLDDAITVFDPSLVVAEDFHYQTSQRVQITASSFVNFSCSTYTYPSSATRLFFTDGSANHIYIVDDTSSFSTHLQSRELTFDPTTDPDFDGYTVETLLKLEVAASDPSKGVLIFTSTDTNNSMSYWVGLVNLANGFCDGSLPIVELRQLEGFPETATNNIQISIINSLIDSQPQKWFLIGTDNSQFALFKDDLTVHSDLIAVSDIFTDTIEQDPRGIVIVPNREDNPFIHIIFGWNGAQPSLSATYSIDDDTIVENSNFIGDFQFLDVIGVEMPEQSFHFTPDQDAFFLDAGIEDDNKSFISIKNLDDLL